LPTFCRHGRFLQNCRICSAPDPAAKPKPAQRSSAGASTSSRSPSTSSSRRGSSAVVVKRLVRAAEDGYENELVPGLKASGDARRLAAELAFSAARLAELAADPPGLYADVAVADDPEEGLWLAFQIAHLGPLSGTDDPFSTIRAARTTWASGEPPPVGEGALLGPRTTVDPNQPTRTAAAYRAWAARAGSQATAFAGEAAWTPERRFSRLFERLSLPGFGRGGRVEFLVSAGRLGLAEIEPAELRLGAEASDEATLAAKRVFGIGDAFLLERRATDLADEAGVPLAALDLALFNFGQPENRRATMGASADADADAQARIEAALGL
jgi:hypothetical protein